MSTDVEHQDPALGVSSRKRLRTATPGPSAEAITLQSAMREIQELRNERLQERADFEAQLRQRDEMLRSMEERMRLLDNELSRNNSNNFRSDSRERVGTRENIELGFKLKPDNFDGTVPLREFFAQFEFIARANCWSDAAKNVALVSCLRGKAREVLECVGENFNYAELKSRLELRFGESHLSQSYYSIFTNRKQKTGEDEATLGSDLERLSQLAYPECPHAVRDKIACAQFVSALSSGFIRRTLQLEGITSLKVAVQRAKAIKVIQESTFERQKDFNFKKNNVNRNGVNNFNGDKKENSERGNSKERKDSGKRFFNKEKRFVRTKECWQCGKTGHFRAKYPSLKEENKGN